MERLPFGYAEDATPSEDAVDWARLPGSMRDRSGRLWIPGGAVLGKDAGSGLLYVHDIEDPPEEILAMLARPVSEGEFPVLMWRGLVYLPNLPFGLRDAHRDALPDIEVRENEEVPWP